jgi:ribosomal protein L12E/L44/L45/RPP1/RPP2
VIFWTDFSGGRKTPLEVTTLFAHTETRAEALVRKLIDENVTKGFERADGPKAAVAAAAPAEAAEDKPKKKAPRKKTDAVE